CLTPRARDRQTSGDRAPPTPRPGDQPSPAIRRRPAPPRRRQTRPTAPPPRGPGRKTSFPQNDGRQTPMLRKMAFAGFTEVSQRRLYLRRIRVDWMAGYEQAHLDMGEGGARGDRDRRSSERL